MTRIEATRGRRYLRLSGILVVLAALVGCGHGESGAENKGASPRPAAQQAPASQAQGEAQQGLVNELHIDDYGPHEAKAGEPFNPQPDGSSAAWFRLNKSLEGSLVNVHLNNVVIKGDISGPMVTVRVPADLHAAEGHIRVSVDKVDGIVVTHSNVVDIVLSKP